MRKFMAEAGMLKVEGTGPEQQVSLLARPQDPAALRTAARKLEAVIRLLEN
jgi:hypothetical protein